MTTPDDGLAARLAKIVCRLDGMCRETEAGDYKFNFMRNLFRVDLDSAYRSGQLITLADHTRLVKEAVEGSAKAMLADVDEIRARYAPIGSAEWSSYTRVRTAIRARGGKP